MLLVLDEDDVVVVELAEGDEADLLGRVVLEVELLAVAVVDEELERAVLLVLRPPMLFSYSRRRPSKSNGTENCPIGICPSSCISSLAKSIR